MNQSTKNLDSTKRTFGLLTDEEREAQWKYWLNHGPKPSFEGDEERKAALACFVGLFNVIKGVVFILGLVKLVEFVVKLVG